MLISLTALLVLTAHAEPTWPATVGLDCQFSQVSHIARRGETWQVVTDLGEPLRPSRLFVGVPDGMWSLRMEGSQNNPPGRPSVVETTATSLTFTAADSEPYDVEPQPATVPGSLLGTDPATVDGRRTWTWFGGPDDEDGVTVRTFVSDRRVTTETGRCRRVPIPRQD